MPKCASDWKLFKTDPLLANKAYLGWPLANLIRSGFLFQFTFFLGPSNQIFRYGSDDGTRACWSRVIRRNFLRPSSDGFQVIIGTCPTGTMLCHFDATNLSEHDFCGKDKRNRVKLVQISTASPWRSQRVAALPPYNQKSFWRRKRMVYLASIAWLLGYRKRSTRESLPAPSNFDNLHYTVAERVICNFNSTHWKERM